MQPSRCPDCRHAVPAGRWCNRCGARLADVASAVWIAGTERGSAPRPVPPEDRTTVVCSDLPQRSIPTAELSTDEPGAVVQVGSRSCVVARPEGAVVP